MDKYIFEQFITKIDGKIAFIENALPNEIVNVKITGVKTWSLDGEIVDDRN